MRATSFFLFRKKPRRSEALQGFQIGECALLAHSLVSQLSEQKKNYLRLGTSEGEIGLFIRFGVFYSRNEYLGVEN